MKWTKNNKCLSAFFACLLLIPPITAFADTKSILNQFGLESNNPVQNVLRHFAWSLAVGLHWLVGGLEDVVYNINGTLGGFFTSSSVKELQDKVLPIAVALIGVLILFIGIMTMIKPQQATNIISNFIVGVAVTIALPTLLTAAYSFTDQVITYINTGSSGQIQSLSDRILVDNVTDMTRFDQEGFKSTTLKYKNYYATSGAKADGITSIDPTEIVNPDDMKNSKVWQNKVVTDRNGKQTLKELSSGKVGLVDVPMFSEYYYRWKFDWLNIFSTLIVTGVALILSSIKIARLLYELAIHQIITQVVALLDVMTAQRLKKCIQTLLATFTTLIAVFFMLQMFIIGMHFISNVSIIYLKLILMIALAWSVIDGPNMFEQLFGVDAGLRSGIQTLYGLKAAGGMLAGGAAALGGRSLMESAKAQGALGIARGMLKKGGSFAGGLGGAAAGVVSGQKDTWSRVNAVKGTASAVTDAAVSSGVASQPTASSAPPSSSKSSSAAQSTSATKGFSVAVAAQAVAAVSNISHNINGSHINAKNSDISQNSGTESLHDEPDLHQESEIPGASAPTPPVRGKASDSSTPITIGGHIRSAVNNKVMHSTPVTSARRAYTLTRGSTQAHGNKVVTTKEITQRLQSEDPTISQHAAKKQAKQQIRQERKGLQNQKSFAEQERESEQRNQLHIKGDDLGDVHNS